MIEIRKPAPEDAAALLHLIQALAAYEKLAPPDEDAQGRLVRDIFAERPRIECRLAELDGKPVGYTLFFETYSSFRALPTLYLEDLFVLPEFRGRRVGSALFRAMIREAHQRGCGRMDWSVLDWNQLAIDFYRRYGARHLREWHNYRLNGEDLEQLLIQEMI